MDIAARVQVLDKTIFISHNTNTFGKGMNPTILPPAMGKIVGQTGLFSLGYGNWSKRRKTLLNTA